MPKTLYINRVVCDSQEEHGSIINTFSPEFGRSKGRLKKCGLYKLGSESITYQTHTNTTTSQLQRTFCIGANFLALGAGAPVKAVLIWQYFTEFQYQNQEVQSIVSIRFWPITNNYKLLTCLFLRFTCTKYNNTPSNFFFSFGNNVPTVPPQFKPWFLLNLNHGFYVSKLLLKYISNPVGGEGAAENFAT